MIVDNFDFVRVSAPPYEANSKLIIYPDAVLTHSRALQSFEVIASRCGEVAKYMSGVQCVQFAARNPLDIAHCRHVFLLE